MQTWFCHKFIPSWRILIANRNVRITITQWLPRKTSYERRHLSVGFTTAEIKFSSSKIIYRQFWRFDVETEIRMNILFAVFNYTIVISFLRLKKSRFDWNWIFHEKNFNHKSIFNATFICGLWMNFEHVKLYTQEILTNIWVIERLLMNLKLVHSNTKHC